MTASPAGQVVRGGGVALLLALLHLPAPALAGESKDIGNPTGRPIPRFVSLKASKVNARRGPGPEYPIAWIYERAGLPVEIIKEYDTWRQIRDSEGSVGWVLQSLLTGRRTALVLPWDAGAEPRPVVAMRRSASAEAGTVARLEAGTLVTVEGCDTAWCTVAVVDGAGSTHRGSIEQKSLWGVYSDEKVP